MIEEQSAEQMRIKEYMYPFGEEGKNKAVCAAA